MPIYMRAMKRDLPPHGRCVSATRFEAPAQIAANAGIGGCENCTGLG